MKNKEEIKYKHLGERMYYEAAEITNNKAKKFNEFRIVDNVTGIVLQNVTMQRKFVYCDAMVNTFPYVDKNGVELWEGDILTDGVNTYKVGYSSYPSKLNPYLMNLETELPEYIGKLKTLTKI